MRTLRCLVILVVAFSVPVWCQDVVFYDDFESGDTAGWWAAARVGETGQKTCWDEDGNLVDLCDGSGHDGDLRPGVVWPNPRFVDNGHGTVTDNLTGLIWLKNGSCTLFFAGDVTGQNDRSWSNALQAASSLSQPFCGLSDGSVPGDWRLPSVNELQSLLDYEYYLPALSDAAGTAQFSGGDAFWSVRYYYYWSSTPRDTFRANAWHVGLDYGTVGSSVMTGTYYVWPVQGGNEVESGDTAGWWAPARVGETGQKTCSTESGGYTDCAGTGQDGDIEPGVAWPSPRFVDNSDGTVTDMLTGLVWLENANCASTTRNWGTALADVAQLNTNGTINSNDCGDTSNAGSHQTDWRLPSVNELLSLVDYEYRQPALSDAAGTSRWSEGDAFSGVMDENYWSSASSARYTDKAWWVDLSDGGSLVNYKLTSYYVWPVRGGQ